MTVTVVDIWVQLSIDNIVVKWLFFKIYVAFNTDRALKSEPPPLVITPWQQKL